MSRLFMISVAWGKCETKVMSQDSVVGNQIMLAHAV